MYGRQLQLHRGSCSRAGSHLILSCWYALDCTADRPAALPFFLGSPPDDHWTAAADTAAGGALQLCGPASEAAECRQQGELVEGFRGLGLPARPGAAGRGMTTLHSCCIPFVLLLWQVEALQRALCMHPSVMEQSAAPSMPLATCVGECGGGRARASSRLWPTEQCSSSWAGPWRVLCSSNDEGLPLSGASSEVAVNCCRRRRSTCIARAQRHRQTDQHVCN